MKMENTRQFENEIVPFYWVEEGTGASVCLSDLSESGGYLSFCGWCHAVIDEIGRQILPAVGIYEGID